MDLVLSLQVAKGFISSVRFPDGQPCSLLTKACLTAADPRIFYLQTWENLFN